MLEYNGRLHKILAHSFASSNFNGLLSAALCISNSICVGLDIVKTHFTDFGELTNPINFAGMLDLRIKANTWGSTREESYMVDFLWRIGGGKMTGSFQKSKNKKLVMEREANF